MEEPNTRVSDWLGSVCESPKTEKLYIFCWNTFKDYCNRRGQNPDNLVDNYRALKYLDGAKREEFLENWQDAIRGYVPWLNKQMKNGQKRFAPGTVKDCLTAIKSFNHYWKIPLDVDLLKHPYVVYHNRDLKKEEFKQILTFASPRDKVIYLILGESGIRVDNAVNLKYWQIKEDFEAKRVPMKILLPSSTLKDHVGDRWTFIGEDGFRALSDYLTGRTIKDDDYVFKSEKKGKVVGDQFSSASLSTKFNRIVQKLEIAPTLGKGSGKPKKIRLHGLRKYFRNNMKADSAFINFWMGHSLGVDAHYISRDPEEHRDRYKEGYKQLRILGTDDAFTSMSEMQRKHSAEIKELEEKLKIALEQRNYQVACLAESLEWFEKAFKIVVDKYRNDPEFPLGIEPATPEEKKDYFKEREDNIQRRVQEYKFLDENEKEIDRLIEQNPKKTPRSIIDGFLKENEAKIIKRMKQHSEAHTE